MTVTDKREDIFMLQVRLYRMLQNRLGLSSVECNDVFDKYGLFDYIVQCYEEYHMQGDEANYADMLEYLRGQEDCPRWMKFIDRIEVKTPELALGSLSGAACLHGYCGMTLFNNAVLLTLFIAFWSRA